MESKNLKGSEKSVLIENITDLNTSPLQKMDMEEEFLERKSHISNENVDTLYNEGDSNYDFVQIFKCAKCSELFSRFSQLSRHLRSHKVSEESDDSQYECHICNKICNHQTSYLIHMRSHSVSKSHVCKECGASFSQTGHLLIHQRTHIGEKSFPCGICSESFTQVSSLKAHIRSHSSNKSGVSDGIQRNNEFQDEQFVCQFCGLSYLDERSLDQHICSNFGNTSFQCEICGTAFGDINALNNHKDAHSHYGSLTSGTYQNSSNFENDHIPSKRARTENAFQCPVCDFKLKSQTELSSHMEIHIVKTYTCDHCPAAFSKLSLLKRHNMSHLNGQGMSSNFKNSSPSKSHIFPCSLCDLSFPEKRHLKRHLFSAHKNPSRIKDQVEVEGNNLVIDEMYYPTVSNSVVIGSTNDVNGEVIMTQNITPNSQPRRIESFSSIDRQEPKSHFIVSTVDTTGKTMRPVGHCQNHSQHVLAMVEDNPNEWQTLCSCDPPNIPTEVTTQILVPISEGNQVSSLSMNPVYVSGPIHASVIDSSTQVIMALNAQDSQEPSNTSQFSISDPNAIFTATSGANTYYISAPSGYQNNVIIGTPSTSYYSSA